jgi:hypothetical protein
LSTEPDTRATVETARAWGVSRSVFLGRIVAPGDPLFTESDRQWATALHLLEQGTHACGQPSSESFAKDSDGAYVAEAIRCHACAAAAREAATFSEHSEGLFVTTRRIISER